MRNKDRLCVCVVIGVKLNWLLIKFTRIHAILNMPHWILQIDFPGNVIIICQLIRANELCNRHSPSPFHTHTHMYIQIFCQQTIAVNCMYMFRALNKYLLNTIYKYCLAAHIMFAFSRFSLTSYNNQPSCWCDAMRPKHE